MNDCPPDIAALDRADPLAHYRAQFQLPTDVSYFDGNSLGALPRVVTGQVRDAVEQAWGHDLVRAWNSRGWIDLPAETAARIAPLLGAAPHQVMVCDSVSVNLFKLLAVGLQLGPARREILTQTGNFPTDVYIARGLAALVDRDIHVRDVSAENLADALNENTAVLMLTHVDYRSGQMHDIKALTQQAHACGAKVLWDLSHSAGAVPLSLDAHSVDLAVGCGYKYLNGGPGAPAWVYVAESHHDSMQQPLSGWMGHSAPFAFEADYQPAPGIAQFASGTPPILALTALHAALEVFDGIDMHSLREKSVALGHLCQTRIAASRDLDALELFSPTDPHARGSQISYRHPEAFAIAQALIEAGMIVDFRAPDVLRIGFAPLYVRYADVWTLVNSLETVMREERFNAPHLRTRGKVT